MSAKDRRRNHAAVHSHPLPVRVQPLPAFHPTNPLSFLRLAYFLISERLNTNTDSTFNPVPSPSHPTLLKGYYSPATRSVHVTGTEAVCRLWEDGFFGKGSLSRSEPEWLERERRRLKEMERGKKGGTAGEVTERRREERREEKRERARREREELEERLKAEGKLAVEDVAGDELESQGRKKEENDAALIGDEQKQNGAVTYEQGEKIDAERMNGSATKLERSSRDGDGAKAQMSRHGAQKGLQHETQDPRSSTSTRPLLKNQEHLQLTPQEAFFLKYGAGILEIYPQSSFDKPTVASSDSSLSTYDLLELFRRTSTFPPLPSPREVPLPPDDSFLVNYLVFHHFRSLGWVVRPGIKFAVDWLLYAKGPVFAHAEFAVLVLPSYERWSNEQHAGGDNVGRHTEHGYATVGCREHAKWRERGEWWWLHSANRVQNQVKKTLVVVYVSIPTEKELADIEHDETGNLDIGALLKLYHVREFTIKRWSPNRNRD